MTEAIEIIYPKGIGNAIQKFNLAQCNLKAISFSKEELPYIIKNYKNKFCIYFLIHNRGMRMFPTLFKDINSKDRHDLNDFYENSYIPSLPTVYIGQSTKGSKRFISHHIEKWEDGILFFSNSEKGFSQNDLNILENFYFKYLKRNIRGTASNTNTPPKGATSSGKHFLDIQKIIYDINNILYIYKPNIFDLNNVVCEYVFDKKNKFVANANIINNQFTIIHKGSKASIKCTSSVDNYIHTIRQELINNNIIRRYNNYYQFEKDYVFSSPSTAASTIYYGNKNGKLMWKPYDLSKLI